jgi:hypothetical protein
MRLRLCALLALSACYAPKVVGGAPCDPDGDSCPSGQRCEPVGSEHFCTGGASGDAGSDDGEPTDGARTCLGARLLGSVCLAQPPTAPLAFGAAATINTALTMPGHCAEIRPQAGGPSLCLVTATTIDVPPNAVVRAIGPYPLVLLATGRITITGTLDVASHRLDTLDGKPVSGAGARTALECNALGIDGTNAANPNNGGGGAAGGSFAGTGGVGGNGRGGTARGNPRPASTSSVLVGGCPGGHGGGGAGGFGGGVGGNGGGAIYLIAGDAITIVGKLNASGTGGDPGSDGGNSSGGGGGGGAGGMIGLEAARVEIAGQVLANGGGGGGGGGNMFDRPGSPGGDPMAPQTAATGGAGGDGGGGNGGAGSTAPLVGGGGNAGNNTACGGGGGGGAGGIVHIYGTVTQAGMVSPPPT